jgi:hypothetical protein
MTNDEGGSERDLAPTDWNKSSIKGSILKKLKAAANLTRENSICVQTVRDMNKNKRNLEATYIIYNECNKKISFIFCWLFNKAYVLVYQCVPNMRAAPFPQLSQIIERTQYFKITLYDLHISTHNCRSCNDAVEVHALQSHVLTHRTETMQSV